MNSFPRYRSILEIVFFFPSFFFCSFRKLELAWEVRRKKERQGRTFINSLINSNPTIDRSFVEKEIALKFIINNYNWLTNVSREIGAR